MPTLEVRSRITGGQADTMPTVLVELAAESISVRALIRSAVEEQIRELVIGRPAASAREALARQYLGDDDIREQAARGAVRLPSPDPEVGVDRATTALREGRFVMVQAGRQLMDLDEVITVRLGEPVTFLRLRPLAGG